MGKRKAPITQEIIEIIITENPLDILLRMGANLNIQLKIMDIVNTIATGL